MCQFNIRTGAERSRSIGCVFCLLCRTCPRMALLNRSHSLTSNHTAKPSTFDIMYWCKERKNDKRVVIQTPAFTLVSFCVASMKTRLSVTTKPPIAVWSEPVRSRALHRQRQGRRVRVRATSRALLRICPLQQSLGPGLAEVAVARLNYLRSDSVAAPPVNCDWLSRCLNVLILGAVPFAEQGWGEVE